MSRLGSSVTVGGVALCVIGCPASDDPPIGDGSCPDGEICSALTPAGLRFEGPSSGYGLPDRTVRPVAYGGFETLHVIDNATDQALALPFVPRFSDAWVSATPGEAATVTVGSFGDVSYLRILSPEGELYDRIPIHSYPITEPHLVPDLASSYPSVLPQSWAAFAGGRTRVAVQLQSEGGAVVDEGMTIGGPASTQVAWDTVEVTPTLDHRTLWIDAGQRIRARVWFDVVDTIDRIATIGDRAVGVGGDQIVCFTAFRSRTDGEAAYQVIGVPLQIWWSGPAEPAAEQPYDACVILAPIAPGDVVVTATGAGKTASVTLHVAGAP